MNKSIELTESQIKAYENGATIYMFPINNKDIIKHNGYDTGKFDEDEEHYIEFPNFPIKKGDKEIFIKEKGIFTTYHRCYKVDADKNLRSDLTFEEKIEYSNINWQPASQMTKEQSRYSFKECTNIKVIRVTDICGNDKANIIGEEDKMGYILDDFKSFYNQQLKEQGINRIYDDNDYVFLVEFKR